MLNSRFDSHEIRRVCERKLGIAFKSGKEYNGWYRINGRKTKRITVPKGRKFVPPNTYSSMARQLGLTSSQFDDMLICTITRVQYDSLLRGEL